MRGISLRSFTLWEWTILGFSRGGIVLGVATLIVVLSVMNGFRKELLEKLGDANASIIAEALKTKQNLIFLMLVLIVLIIGLNMLAGLILFWRERSSRTGS